MTNTDLMMIACCVFLSRALPKWMALIGAAAFLVAGSYASTYGK